MEGIQTAESKQGINQAAQRFVIMSSVHEVEWMR